MAMTLVEASKLSTDTLLTGVIETITQESPLLQLLPWIPVLGNGLAYNRENDAATVAFYDVGDNWAENTPTFSQETAALKIMGGDADVDNFLKKTRSNLQDLEAEIIALKAKALRNLLEDTFINGNSGVDPNSFDGLDSLCAGGQTVSMGVNGGVLTLEKLDEMIDRIRPGKPDALLISRRTRRSMNALMRASGYMMEFDRDQFGMMVGYYDGIPLVINDYISDAKTVGTSADCSTIYAVKLLPYQGLCGITADDSIVIVEPIGSLETKDASRTRVKAYASLALFNTQCLASLAGVRA